MPYDLLSITAPMVNQSDLPFRILTRKYGATLAYTQMLLPDKILDDPAYLEYHLRDLQADHDPVIVQLCGNDPEVVVRAGKMLQPYCDGIGCPQEHAKQGHYGAYLLPQKDWPLVEQIVSAMSHSLAVPVSTKIRLTQPASSTPLLAGRLEHAGASWITLHARHVSAQRRRHGAADLSEVARLKGAVDIPVVSNGNVRTWDDVAKNRATTSADGIMVGEALLGNPALFSGTIPDAVEISLEYLELCRVHPGIVALQNMQTHIRHFIETQCARRPWFPKFRSTLKDCHTIDDIEALLRTKVQRWRGKQPLARDDAEASSSGSDDESVIDFVLDLND
ncbi:hypothetical protein PLICRDRAFT_57589 [Plicaturopsis crispa FD-325 SS-3]|uniref:DUS-like FMN-binding domain-containing protein n=1 Tax=Plicaturopsis crispa FD-325 SS-3 TaxID=944288 RepID=A0A0C9SRF9_PLICR|nr:hypothetical protein PLICRDRAFT_57589 [Plicaturopsis crispa FD-325 SS-3]